MLPVEESYYGMDAEYSEWEDYSDDEVEDDG